MSIGKNISKLRKDKKMTQSQLADKLGVSVQAVSKWENDLCAPDIALFPTIATIFGVSIDRIFDFHIAGYGDEVEAIMRKADNSRDTYKEIEIISEGLERYPNSPDLKVYLAFSLSMVNRFSKDENEKKNAIEKAISLCNEVVDTCGIEEKVNDALNMIRRIYVDIGNYEKALDAVDKMSADNYCDRIRGLTAIYTKKKDAAGFYEFAENNLWKLFFTTDQLLEKTAEYLFEKEEYQKALCFLSARQKLLSVFDDGCQDFYIAHKIDTCDMTARIYAKLKYKEKCLSELQNLIELAKREKNIPKDTDYRVSARNPMYFSYSDKNLFEENFVNLHIENKLKKYDSFFGEDEEYKKLKDNI